MKYSRKRAYPKTMLTHFRKFSNRFRDIKSRFGFGELVLKKPTHARAALLRLTACLAYGLLFLSYEESEAHWAKAFNATRKMYSVITVIKRVLSDTWIQEGSSHFSEIFSLEAIPF